MASEPEYVKTVSVTIPSLIRFVNGVSRFGELNTSYPIMPSLDGAHVSVTDSLTESVCVSFDGGGIIVIDGRFILHRAISGLAKLICLIWDAEAKLDWKNRTGYLRPVRH